MKMEIRILAFSMVFFVLVLAAEHAPALDLSPSQTVEWCEFYSELAGEFHIEAQTSSDQEEYTANIMDYIRQIDEVAKHSEWTDGERKTWMPEFAKLAESAWELRHGMTTPEVEQSVLNKCYADHGDKDYEEFTVEALLHARVN